MSQPEHQQFTVGDKNGTRSPSSELDIMGRALSSTKDDGLLEDANLGLGNYDEREYWQQVQAYRMHMYGDAAFGRRLEKRAIRQTKRELALNGWHIFDEKTDQAKQYKGWNDLSDRRKAKKESKEEYLEERGEEIWRKLRTDLQEQALKEHAGGAKSWTTPHGRMLKMRHEASRSKHARLLDNLFGRVKEVKGNAREAAEKQLAAIRSSGDQ